MMLIKAAYIDLMQTKMSETYKLSILYTLAAYSILIIN